MMFGYLERFSSAFYCVLVTLVVSISLNIWFYTKGIQTSSKHRNSTIQTSLGAPETHETRQTEVAPGWWTDASRFRAEQRAIFSKSWLCVSHHGRFVKPGDYVSQDVAGYKFFLILGKDNVVRAFHNICRHRAFPVAVKASGSTTVLGCKYHGWSYDTKGKLVKAPQFDALEGFDKSANSLYEIKTKKDEYGFLYINLSDSEDVRNTVPSVVRSGRPGRIDQNSRFLHSCEFRGKFNWKLAVHENSWTGLAEPQTTASIPATGFLRAFSSRPLTPTGRLKFFPLTTAYTKTGSGLWYQISYSPASEQQTTLRCDVYTNNIKKSGKFEFDDDKKDRLERQLRSKIQEYETAHAELAKSNYAPDDQLKIAEIVEDHLKQEKLHGAEVHPAVKQCQGAAFSQAEGIYRALACSNENLDW